MTKLTPFGEPKERQAWLSAAFTCAALPGFIPVTAWLTGVTILPSVAYHRIAFWPTIVLAILIAGLFVLAVELMRAYVRLGIAEYANGRQRPSLLIVIGLFIGPLSATGLALVPPLLVALIKPEPVTLTYTVAEVHARIGRSCRRAIRVAELGFFDATLCHVPLDLWNKLAVGDHVTISGPGSRLGVLLYPWAEKDQITITGRLP